MGRERIHQDVQEQGQPVWNRQRCQLPFGVTPKRKYYYKDLT